jgi:hypothetical protein
MAIWGNDREKAYRHAIYKPFPESIPTNLSIHLQDWEFHTLGRRPQKVNDLLLLSLKSSHVDFPLCLPRNVAKHLCSKQRY